MKNLQILAEQLNILPKLRLGNKLEKGGVQATGPHHVKFLEEPVTVMGRDEKGAPRKELKFIVEEGNIKYRWQVPILGKDGQPSYLIERLMNIEVGDERILEMCKQGIKNFIDVRPVGGLPELPDVDEDPDDSEDNTSRPPYPTPESEGLDLSKSL